MRWLRIAFGSGFAIAVAMLWRRVQYTLRSFYEKDRTIE